MMSKRSQNERRKQLLGICEALPEIDIAGDPHWSIRIRKKAIAWYVNDHHGDGIVGLWCKTTLARQRELVTRNAEHYFVPPYVGPSGWIGIRLDRPTVDWEEVAELLFAAYRMQAPKRLAAQLG